MFIPRMTDDGPGAGKWYMMLIEGKATPRRTGYCAANCTGHSTQSEAVEHHLQYQLDREAALWLDRRAPQRSCEICGESTTLRARLGRNTSLYVLCRQHQSTGSLEALSRRRTAAPAAPGA